MFAREGDGTSWTLAFDAGCGHCTSVATAVRGIAGDRLDIRPLSDPAVVAVRRDLLGAKAPWKPTLIKQRGSVMQAVTGARLGLELLRILGPRRAGRVVSILRRGGGTELDHAPNGSRRSLLKLTPLVAAGAATGVMTMGSRPTAAQPSARQLAGSERNQHLGRLMSDSEVRALLRHFEADGYRFDRQDAEAFAVVTEDHEELLLTRLPLSSTREAHQQAEVFHSAGPAHKEVRGALISNDGHTSLSARAFRAGSHGVEQVATLERNADGDLRITTSQGETTTVGLDHGDVAPAAHTDCHLCHQIAGPVYAAGCGVSGYFVCLGVCAPFANVTCPVICAAVWALICYYGYEFNEETLCGNWC